MRSLYPYWNTGTVSVLQGGSGLARKPPRPTLAKLLMPNAFQAEVETVGGFSERFGGVAS